MIVVNLDVMLAKRKMSVTELSQRVGITMANLSILKNGKSKAIRMSTLDAICTALQCQPGDILEWRPDEAAQADRPEPQVPQETQVPPEPQIPQEPQTPPEPAAPAPKAPPKRRTAAQKPTQPKAKAKEPAPSRPRQPRKPTRVAEPAPVRYLTVNTYGSRLNLRDTGSRNGNVVARLPSGARVELLETDGAWVHVRWEDKTGWALATYLKEL